MITILSIILVLALLALAISLTTRVKTIRRHEAASCEAIARKHKETWKVAAADETMEKTDAQKEYERGCIDTCHYLEGRYSARQ